MTVPRRETVRYPPRAARGSPQWVSGDVLAKHTGECPAAIRSTSVVRSLLVQSSGIEVEQNIDGLARSLAFAKRIGAVFDCHRDLDERESARGDLIEDFRRVRHAVLAQPDVHRASARHRTQTVVGVGDREPGRDPREPGGSGEKQASRPRYVGYLLAKSTSQRIIGLVHNERVEQADDVV